MRGTLLGFTEEEDKTLLFITHPDDGLQRISVTTRAFDRFFDKHGNAIYDATVQVEGGKLTLIEEEDD